MKTKRPRHGKGKKRSFRPTAAFERGHLTKTPAAGPTDYGPAGNDISRACVWPHCRPVVSDWKTYQYLSFIYSEFFSIIIRFPSLIHAPAVRRSKKFRRLRNFFPSQAVCAFPPGALVDRVFSTVRPTVRSSAAFQRNTVPHYAPSLAVRENCKNSKIILGIQLVGA